MLLIRFRMYDNHYSYYTGIGIITMYFYGVVIIIIITQSSVSTVQALLKLTGLNSLPQSRKAVFSKLHDPETGDAIDHALVLWFPGSS